MKVGDLVACWPNGTPETSDVVRGVIVGFGEKGEGGKDFVHVFCGGIVMTFMSFDIDVIHESR